MLLFLSKRKWQAITAMLVSACPVALSANDQIGPDAAHVVAEWQTLSSQIAESNNWGLDRLRNETYRQEALILPSDVDPNAVVNRQLSGLIDHLEKSGVDLAAEKLELQAINKNASQLDSQGQFAKLTNLRRRVAFKNPLLDFDKLLFLKHDKMVRGERHMVDQYLGFNQSKRGGVFVLHNPFSDDAKTVSLSANASVENGRLKGKQLENKGSFISLELDYEGEYIYFAFTEAEHQPRDKEYSFDEDPLRHLKNINGEKAHFKSYYNFTPSGNFQIMRMKADGTELTALTDASHNDFDPCILPSGRIVFISDRIEGNQRCGGRYNSTFTLHSMMPDGSDIIPLSHHDTNEWHPSVDNNGMIIYTRWDYVDRDSDVAHHIWHCFPDGRNPRAYHGNYPKVREHRPWMELSHRAIPGSDKYLSVSVPHHGENYGSLIMLDLKKEDDGGMSQVKRITPEVLFPEAEKAPGVPHAKGKHKPNGEIYGQPWPLSEDFYICTYSPDGDKHGIYLVDSFGNKELLYRDSEIGCLDPMPLRARKKPREIPVQTTQALADKGATGQPVDRQHMEPGWGTVSIMNVYASKHEWPKDTVIKELRVVNPYPKPNYHQHKPKIGHANQSIARGILGTAPVEKDGSAYFKVPVGMPIYFQAVDENGFMVQNMRSITYLHEGENLSCVGCHESKQSTPINSSSAPLAMTRPPSPLVNDLEGSYPLTFPRMVQPILDQHCVSCHDSEESAGSLRGDKFDPKLGWSEAFTTLNQYAWGKHGGNGGINKNKRSYSLPGQEGFRVSKLYKILVENDHHGVQLSDDEMRRIAAWVDCNSNFYGAYVGLEEQARGEVVPPLLGLPPQIPFDQLQR